MVHVPPVTHSFTNNHNETIPGIGIQNRIQWLISRYNPQAEAVKLCQNTKDLDISIIFGWGRGYLPRELSTRSQLLIILEPLCLKKFYDQNLLPQNGKIFWIDESKSLPDQITQILQEFYYSLMSTSLGFWSLAGYDSAFPDWKSEIQKTVTRYIDYGSRDLGIQALFGGRWFENTLRNFKFWNQTNLSWESFFSKPYRKIYCLGAGPSLQNSLADIHSNRNTSFIIAADTLLPVLEKWNIIPELYVSLDSQWFSTLHTIGIHQKGSMWIVDGASQPGLVRRLNTTLPRFSNHPFTDILHEMGLPPIRTPNYNNVGAWINHLGKTFGDRLQIPVSFSGFDGSYPGYRSYVQGTYLEPWYSKYRSRFKPHDSWDFSVMSRNNSDKLDFTKTGYTYADFKPVETFITPYPLDSLSAYSKVDWKALGHSVLENLIEKNAVPPGHPASWYSKPWITTLYPEALGLMKRNGLQNIQQAMELTQEKVVKQMHVFLRSGVIL